MKNNKAVSIISAILLIIMAAAFSGCGDEESILAGIYTKEVDGISYQLELTKDFVYKVSPVENEDEPIIGTYYLIEDKITFNEQSGNNSCRDKGGYKFILTEDSLSLETNTDTAQDECANRKAILSGKWDI